MKFEYFRYITYGMYICIPREHVTYCGVRAHRCTRVRCLQRTCARTCARISAHFGAFRCISTAFRAHFGAFRRISKKTHTCAPEMRCTRVRSVCGGVHPVCTPCAGTEMRRNAPKCARNAPEMRSKCTEMHRNAPKCAEMRAHVRAHRCTCARTCAMNTCAFFRSR